MQSDEKFQFGSTEALLGAYRAIQQRVDVALPGLLKTQPKGRFKSGRYWRNKKGPPASPTIRSARRTVRDQAFST